MAYSSVPDDGFAVSGTVLHALAGSGSAAAEDDGVCDAGVFRVYLLDVLLGAGALLGGWERNLDCAAGGDEPDFDGTGDAGDCGEAGAAQGGGEGDGEGDDDPGEEVERGRGDCGAARLPKTG